ncbi:hypothetical protein B0H11DRAFT_2372783 [Mycena galericulata]|nr:hypothetical protein B0H11DRAFT_2372783 [Mycena galericulata]
MPPSLGAGFFLAPLQRLIGQVEAGIQRELHACKDTSRKTSDERDSLEVRLRASEDARIDSEQASFLDQDARRAAEVARETAEAALRTERNLRRAEQTEIETERKKIAEIGERIPRTLEPRFSEINEEIGHISQAAVDDDDIKQGTTKRPGTSIVGPSQSAVNQVPVMPRTPQKPASTVIVVPRSAPAKETSSKRKRSPNPVFLSILKGHDVSSPPRAQPNEGRRPGQPDFLSWMTPMVPPVMSTPTPPSAQLKL